MFKHPWSQSAPARLYRSVTPVQALFASLSSHHPSWFDRAASRSQPANQRPDFPTSPPTRGLAGELLRLMDDRGMMDGLYGPAGRGRPHQPVHQTPPQALPGQVHTRTFRLSCSPCNLRRKHRCAKMPRNLLCVFLHWSMACALATLQILNWFPDVVTCA